MTPILQLANVESNYGPVQALRGVSLAVEEGKIVAVLGANGAGKTTTLKTISGIIDPLKGQVKFRGQEIQGQSPDAIVRGGIVHVPEGREVFPLLSVEDNLRMGAFTRSDGDGVAQDMEAVYGYFPILRERKAQEAGQLSGGQQQMLAIARALLARPAVMLMDEPSLGLSPKLTREIFDIVVRINRERGVTILLVEQNAHMALKIADFGYVLEVGRIVPIYESAGQGRLTPRWFRRVIHGVLENLPPQATIGVVTPYRAQSDEIEARLGDSHDRVRVGTAHKFQGGERDVVVLSLVAARNERPHVFDWADQQPELWNVAITRARSKLIIVGDEWVWAERGGIDQHPLVAGALVGLQREGELAAGANLDRLRGVAVGRRGRVAAATCGGGEEERDEGGATHGGDSAGVRSPADAG